MKGMTVCALRDRLAEFCPTDEVRFQVEDEVAQKVTGAIACRGGDYLPYDGEEGDEPVVFLYGDWWDTVPMEAKGGSS